MKRHGRFVIAAALAAALAAPASAAASDLLPDLGMARLQDFKVDRTSDGRRLLRYTAIVVNTGVGRFQLQGTRASATDPEMAVSQRIFDSGGGYRDQATSARMYFAGDGHHHWHVRDLESSVLERLDNGVKAGTGAKHGFCFFDNYAFRLSLAGAPGSPYYTTCGTDPATLSQSMGLSIGWGDVYSYQLVDQWIDITSVSPGQYRLTTTADAQNWFAETNDLDNFTWVDIQIKEKGQPRVYAYGPAA